MHVFQIQASATQELEDVKHESKVQNEFLFNIVVELFSFAEYVENHSRDVASINITIH